MTKPRCILSVDVEAFPMRAPDRYVDTLIYGRFNGDEYGIGRMMDIADKHGIKMTFFLDFGEVKLHGDEIIQVGKYIASRGHDLQIHCHIDCLEQTVKERFPNASKLYWTWYHSEEISDFMISYCLEQYYKCSPNNPTVYRGGAYRFSMPLLKILKKKGVIADATYNMLRPIPLPPKKQFFYENGLLELPIGIVPGIQQARQLNFNADRLYPKGEHDGEYCLEAYEQFFSDYYNYYGADAVASLVMHSWSFCHERTRFQESGYIDRPNPYAADLFDRFLGFFKNQIDFITAAQAAQVECRKHLKTERFTTVFAHQEIYSQENLKRIFNYVREKANGREIIVWGKGWTESEVFGSLDVDVFTDLNVKAYISRDARYKRIWRGRPVKTFEEAQINPETHYIFVCAQPIFPEIREMLREAGFKEHSDYYDFAKYAIQE